MPTDAQVISALETAAAASDQYDWGTLAKAWKHAIARSMASNGTEVELPAQSMGADGVSSSTVPMAEALRIYDALQRKSNGGIVPQFAVLRDVAV